MTEQNQIPSKEEIEQRKKEIKNTLCCPHCGERLQKWAVPQTLYTTWPNEFMYVCFNDECPYMIRSYEAVARMGNPGTCRLMYDPLQDCCQPIPVLNNRALKDNIIQEGEESRAGAEPEEQAEEISKEAIVGTWKLVSFEHLSEDGEITRPLGEAPVGFLVYSDDGRITVQNAAASGVLLPIAALDGRTSHVKEAALEIYGGYSGRYEIISAGRIVHHIETSLFPTWAGLSQKRTIRIEGGNLTLVSPPLFIDGQVQTATMVWERSD